MQDLASTFRNHDPGLAERLRFADENPEIALAVRLDEDTPLPAYARQVSRFGDIATLRVAATHLAQLLASPAIVAGEAPRPIRTTQVPDLVRGATEFAETDDAGCDDDLADDGHTRRPPGVRGTGRGVMVGIADWGIDPFHPDFIEVREGQPRSRIRGIFDMRTRSANVDRPNRFGYGRLITRQEIEAAMGADDPYAVLGYHPGDSDRRERGGGWGGTHGTHVASIAAGNGRGGGPSGVAPGAEIGFCHLSGTVPVLSRGSLGDSVTIIESIDYLFELAGLSPCVINYSVGAHGGPHDGSSAVERCIDFAVSQRPNRAIVNSAGNYRQRRTHAAGRIRQGETLEIPFRVPRGDTTRNEIEIYYESADLLCAEIVGPEGEVLTRVEAGNDGDITIDGARVGRVYHQKRMAGSSSGDRLIDLFLDRDAPDGDWSIRLHGESVRDGRFHAWIERDNGKSPVFTGALVNERFTTGTLCNGVHAITVGAVDAASARRDPGSFSSQGPTRDGRIKPEIVAPGVAICAARSTPPGGPRAGRYTRKSGTSMAAPHVTGAVALVYEAAIVPLDIADLRSVLFSTAERGGRAGERGADTLHIYGNGVLDIVAAERAAARLAQAQARTEDLSAPPVPEDEIMDEAITENTSETAAICRCHGESGKVEESSAAETPTPLPDLWSMFPEQPVDEERANPQLCDDGWMADDLDQPLPPIETDWQALAAHNAGYTQWIEDTPFEHFGGTVSAFRAPTSVRDWRDLVRFRVPSSIVAALAARSPRYEIQTMASASSDNVNLDFYPIRVTQMPVWGGRRLTARQLFEVFRVNINDFIDTSKSSFRPATRTDLRRWAGASPVGSVIHIDIPIDDAFVVCSEYSPYHWRFSTLKEIHLLIDNDHPVSGTREFGYQETGSSTYYYTMGADRSSYPTEWMARLGFRGGHQLWLSFQREFVNWVHSHHGMADRPAFGSPPVFNISNRHNYARLLRMI